jgi:phage terminase Nu1 subunit (DNA packaging protein)
MRRLTKSHRWTIPEAAPEFGVDRQTLADRLRRMDESGGPDGKFSTQQILRACFSDDKQERTRLTTAQADLAEIKKAEALGHLFDADTVREVWTDRILSLRTRLMLVPGVCESRYVQGMTGAEVRKLIDTEQRSALEELSKDTSYMKENRDDGKDNVES